MQVKSVVVSEKGEKVSLMLFSRRVGLQADLRRLWCSRNVHYSASSLRLLLFLSMSGGSSVGVLKSWMGRASMPQCYVKVSEGYVSRYGRGKGVLACYKLTERGQKLVEDSLQVVRNAIDYEIRNLPKNKARLQK